MNKHNLSAPLLATLLACVALLSGCESKESPTTKLVAKPVAADPLLIQITPALSALVKTSELTVADVKETLRIAGRLDLNSYNTARVGAPVAGRISEVLAVFGQQVKRGETLASINSQELTQAQLVFLKAHSALQLSSRAVERAELLLSADVIGSAELQRRQAELTVARAEKRAAIDQLRILGLPMGSIDSLEKTGRLNTAVPITASQSGTVIERKITLGQVVQPSDALFLVSDLKSLWAQAEVPEQEAVQVKLGQKVEIIIPALGNEKRIGKIVYVADVVNPETRTVRVGVDIDNAGKLLKPQMLITMMVEGQTTRKTVVPAAAVVRENDIEYLFVESQLGLVRLTPAKLGPEKLGLRAVLEGPQPGIKVVTEGAFHLNNERIKRNLESKG